MELNDIIKPNSVLAGVKAGSKKQVLQELADLAAAEIKIDANGIFESLLERERLGSTGVGNGVAIPHAKIPGIENIHGFVAQLAKPVDFDSLDDQPVDIVFMLLAPEGSGALHLKALARVARILRDQTTLSSLRQSVDQDVIYSLLTSVENANAA